MKNTLQTKVGGITYSRRQFLCNCICWGIHCQWNIHLLFELPAPPTLQNCFDHCFHKIPLHLNFEAASEENLFLDSRLGASHLAPLVSMFLNAWSSASHSFKGYVRIRISYLPDCNRRSMDSWQDELFAALKVWRMKHYWSTLSDCRKARADSGFSMDRGVLSWYSTAG